MLYTLVALTIVSAPSPGVMVNNTAFSEKAACATTLRAVAEGTAALFRANVQAMAGEPHLGSDKGWTLVLSGMGREVARFQCVASQH